MSWKRVSNRDELESFYREVLPTIRTVAKSCGYAIGVHGSMRRDLDLIGVPWIEKFESKDVLAMQIQMAVCGFKMDKYDWEIKPNGRTAVSFPICTVDWERFGEVPLNLCHIDLSVIGGNEGVVMGKKWICPKCKAINPLMSYKCHCCGWEVA